MGTGRKTTLGARGSERVAGGRAALPHERGVLQMKAATPRPAKGPPAAPPVYRPPAAPKVLQAKRAAVVPAQHAARPTPPAPPRTRALPPPALQTKAAHARPPGVVKPPSPSPAPDARRPKPHEAIQAKPAGAHAPTQAARRAITTPSLPSAREKGRGMAAPAPSRARAAGSGARVLQRDTLLDIERLEELRSISRVLRGYGKAEGADSNEFQGMRYGSQILVSGNTQADTNVVFAGLENVSGRAAYSHFSLMGNKALKRGGSGADYDTADFDPELASEIIRDLAVKKNRLFDERFSSSSVNPGLAAGLIGSGGPSLILVGGASGAGLHAEQRLLVTLAHKLATEDDVPDHIQLGGTKPPCTRCQPVVAAFAEGMRRFYGVTLHYVKTGTRKTCGGEVKRITVDDLPPAGGDTPEPYKRLIKFLTTALG